MNEEEHRLLAAVEGRPALIAINKSDLTSGTTDSAFENARGVSAGDFETANQKKVDEPSPQTELSAGEELERDLLLQFPGIAIQKTSAVTGEGIPELRARIVTLATGGAAAEPGMLTSVRQHQAVMAALAALGDATVANQSAIPHEMILIDAYRALWALDSLTGQTTPDDILNLIFSTFCIGK